MREGRTRFAQQVGYPPGLITAPRGARVHSPPAQPGACTGSNPPAGFDEPLAGRPRNPGSSPRSSMVALAASRLRRRGLRHRCLACPMLAGCTCYPGNGPHRRRYADRGHPDPQSHRSLCRPRCLADLISTITPSALAASYNHTVGGGLSRGGMKWRARRLITQILEYTSPFVELMRLTFVRAEGV